MLRRWIAIVSLLLLPSVAVAADSDQAVGGAVVLIVVSVIVFLLCREIFCWYWKLNKMVELLTQIDDRLRVIQSQLPSTSPAATKAQGS